MNRAKHHQNFKADWETPPELFKLLDAEFGPFTIDVCATIKTTKCKRFFSPIQNALVQDWVENICWMNPPYGVGVTEVWVTKAIEAAQVGATVVALLPANTSTQWFGFAASHASRLRFLIGRVAFLQNGIPVRGNTGGSMIMLFTPGNRIHIPAVEIWHWRRLVRKDMP